MDTFSLAQKILEDIHLPSHPPLSQDQFRNKLFGLIFGNALGDAIGLRTEFYSTAESKQIWGDKELTLKNWLEYSRNFQECDWTDDTDQLILILKGFLENSSVDVIDFAKRLFDWRREGFPEFGDNCGMGIGQTVYSVLSEERFLSEPFEAAFQVWENTSYNIAANGALMRTSILGAINYQDLTQVIKQTIDIATVTHADPRCVSSCVALTTAIALQLQGVPWQESYELSINISKICIKVYTREIEMKFISQKPKKNQEKFQENVKVFSEEILERFLRDELAEIGPFDGRSLGFTYICLGCGFWATRQDDWPAAIREIVTQGGDADTNAAVAGAILGCKLGFDSLPANLVKDLLYHDWLIDKVNLLFEKILLTSNTQT